MVGPIFDCDVLGACEVALEVDYFEVLDVEWEEIGLLLVDYCILFAYLDTRVNLSDLLFV